MKLRSSARTQELARAVGRVVQACVAKGWPALLVVAQMQLAAESALATTRVFAKLLDFFENSDVFPFCCIIANLSKLVEFVSVCCSSVCCLSVYCVSTGTDKPLSAWMDNPLSTGTDKG